MAFALALGKNPFALYGDTRAYTALMDEVGRTLIACKVNFRFFYDNKDQLLNGVRSGEIYAAMMWDSGGWLLNRENADIRFINPRSGAIAWMDTFALPARGRNDAAAYAWISLRDAPRRWPPGPSPGPSAISPPRRVPISSCDPAYPRAVRRELPGRVAQHQVVPRDPTRSGRDRGRGPRPHQGSQLSAPPMAAAPATPDLEVRALAKRFATHLAVDDLSFSVARGSFFSILGPSGCGKTTLLRMIAGFIQPDGGEIAIGGRSMAQVPPNRRPVNMVFQHLALFPMMSVAQNVAFGLARRGVGRAERQRRAEAMLERVGLAGAGGKRTEELSGGQRQRVAIARAMVLEPTLLLLDEPLGALDLKLREHMKLELKQLQSAFGTTFVYITHDQSEALVLSDYVGVMNHGRFEQVGTPQELYYSPATAFVAGFVGASNRLAGKALAVDGALVEVGTRGGWAARARAGTER